MPNNGRYTRDGEFTPEFNTVVTETMSQCKIPGLSLAVINGSSTYSKAYGLSHLTPPSPVTPKTLFHIASISKSFTATALALLVSDNETYPSVQWNTPVCQILKEDFVLADAMYTENITIEDLLSHRSGIPNLDDATFGVDSECPDTPRSVTRKLRYLPLTAPLRTAFQYSNTNYVICAHIIETLTHQSLGSFLRDKIWEPLGMEDTYYGMPDLEVRGKVEELARGYHFVDGEENGEYRKVPYPNQPEGSGAGDLISTPLAVIKFLSTFLFPSQSSIPSLSPEAQAELTAPRTIIATSPDSDFIKPIPYLSTQLYCLGLEISSYHGVKVVGHDGRINGYASKMFYLPDYDWGCVGCGNEKGAAEALERLCWMMVDEVIGVDAAKGFNWEKYLNNVKENEDKEGEEEGKLFGGLVEGEVAMVGKVEDYVGVYQHEGFGELRLTYEDDGEGGEGRRLVADAADRTDPLKLYFQHFSGSFFVVDFLLTTIGEKERHKAEFEIGLEGKVEQLGIDFVYEMKDLIWFKKCED